MTTVKMMMAALSAGFIFTGMASAIAPPDVIAEKNLEADLIIIGKVLKIASLDDPAHFILEPIHVIKGVKAVAKNQSVKILLSARPPEDKKIAASTQGILPVKVREESLVIVYLTEAKKHAGYYSPLLEGLSVITIQPRQEK